VTNHAGVAVRVALAHGSLSRTATAAIAIISG
jgi:hypothetical protein